MVQQSAAPDLTELRKLVKDAGSGSATDIAALRGWLAAHADSWKSIADAAVDLQTQMIDAMAGKDVLLREALDQHAQNLRRQLLTPVPSAVERLQAEHVVSNRLLVLMVGLRIVANHVDGRTLHWWLRCEALAQKNFAAASKQLSMLQRLARRPHSRRHPSTSNTVPGSDAPAGEPASKGVEETGKRIAPKQL